MHNKTVKRLRSSRYKKLKLALWYIFYYLWLLKVKAIKIQITSTLGYSLNLFIFWTHATTLYISLSVYFMHTWSRNYLWHWTTEYVDSRRLAGHSHVTFRRCSCRAREFFGSGWKMAPLGILICIWFIFLMNVCDKDVRLLTRWE